MLQGRRLATRHRTPRGPPHRRATRTQRHPTRTATTPQRPSRPRRQQAVGRRTPRHTRRRHTMTGTARIIRGDALALPLPMTRPLTSWSRRRRTSGSAPTRTAASTTPARSAMNPHRRSSSTRSSLSPANASASSSRPAVLFVNLGDKYSGYNVNGAAGRSLTAASVSSGSRAAGTRRLRRPQQVPHAHPVAVRHRAASTTSGSSSAPRSSGRSRTGSPSPSPTGYAAPTNSGFTSRCSPATTRPSTRSARATRPAGPRGGR
jgi:hypothetical protein